ncbi:F0F1 ATP synthase subunit delta [Prevotella koreensis]|uniref:F0F1 ATP synthase subunit delta n=1 Tax=Prevotella koreensis TaxID=2490854 RepID=UPI0028E33EEF|nr:F0F1 ATP synthase subunit delta [Prevotella koreensis]
MDIGVISVRYARALLKSSVQTGCDEKVYHDMVTFTKSFVEVPKLRHTINNPTLSQEKKKQLLITACGVDINPLTRHFVELVIKEGRETVMMFIASSYITLYRKQKNIIHGKLITATTVSPATEQRMKQIVQNKTKGTVEFLAEVNPDIIGGFILEYDTYRMDASVQSQLRDILKTLK